MNVEVALPCGQNWWRKKEFIPIKILNFGHGHTPMPVTPNPLVLKFFRYRFCLFIVERNEESTRTCSSSISVQDDLKSISTDLSYQQLVVFYMRPIFLES